MEKKVVILFDKKFVKIDKKFLTILQKKQGVHPPEISVDKFFRRVILTGGSRGPPWTPPLGGGGGPTDEFQNHTFKPNNLKIFFQIFCKTENFPLWPAWGGRGRVVSRQIENRFFMSLDLTYHFQKKTGIFQVHEYIYVIPRFLPKIAKINELARENALFRGFLGVFITDFFASIFPC